MQASLSILVTRAAHLLALGVAPFAISPDPKAPDAPVIAAIASGVAIAATCGGAAWARARLATRPAAVGAALAWLAVASALGASVFCDRQGLPVGLALPLVGVLLWASVAAFAGAVAARAGRSAAIGAAPVAVLAAALIASAAPWLGSAEAARWRAVHVDPTHGRAVAAIVGDRIASGDVEGAGAIADRCLSDRPSACACLTLRADVALHRAGGDARAPVEAAIGACPRDAAARLIAARWLARTGDATGADRELATASVLDPDPADLAFTRATALERAGRYPEALAAADEAIAAGAGRDARLLAAALRISKNDLEAAGAALDGLAAAFPKDPEVRYDLALVADKGGSFNAAREGYLATLRLDPKHRSARYNLALLTLRAGAFDEAAHHAEAFARTFPGDPSGPQLIGMVASAPRPKR